MADYSSRYLACKKQGLFRAQPRNSATIGLAHKSFRNCQRGRLRGSALLLVLFAIILLSSLVTATVAFVGNDVDEYGALSKQFRARQLAESGLAFGIDPQVRNQDQALLEQVMPDGGRFHVFISSESTKLNINFLLQNGRQDLLSDLFIRSEER